MRRHVRPTRREQVERAEVEEDDGSHSGLMRATPLSFRGGAAVTAAISSAMVGKQKRGWWWLALKGGRRRPREHLDFRASRMDRRA